MTGLFALWIPILLSAAAVFVASSVINMVLPWHKNDYPRLSDEDEVMAALRPFAIPPGEYMMPRPIVRTDMSSPEFIEKMNQGPSMLSVSLSVRRSDRVHRLLRRAVAIVHLVQPPLEYHDQGIG